MSRIGTSTKHKITEVIMMALVVCGALEMSVASVWFAIYWSCRKGVEDKLRIAININ